MTPADAPDAQTRSPSMEDVLLESARLHAMRASILRAEVQDARRASSRGLLGRFARTRAGHRLRFALLVARRTARSLLQDGPGETLDRARKRLRPSAPAASDAPARPGLTARRSRDLAARSKGNEIYRTPIGVPAGQRLRHRVLIAAELSLPQCAKYRAWQKAELIERLGIPCTVVLWSRVPEVLSLLQTHTLLILYRVPGFEGPLGIIEEAARLGVETLWEVDDLIFDVELYAANGNLRDLPQSLQRELLSGAVLFRQAMLACDRTIGSTPELARLMAEASGRPAHIVPNALDAETLAFAEAAMAARRRSDEQIVVVYGSGTLTHDLDFAAAAPALLRLLAEDPRLKLRIIGTLTLPPGFDMFRSRIERLATTNFRAYLAAIAEADISLAPLERSAFNEAKSNIKLIEASIVGLPSVCSPRAEFRNAIEHGVDGFLADDDAEWHRTLRRLLDDPVLRRRVASRARDRVMANYRPALIADAAVRPITALVPALRRRTMRVLAVNIYFAPRSYGGATIVAEEMAQRLAARDDTEIFVFTSHNFPAHQYTLKRYVSRGADVIGIAVPDSGDEILNFDDPEMARRFADVLEAVQPDVVHFHSIQQFGAGIVRACQRARIPYAITVHDAWWLCARQFMVRADNTYCHQTTIDLKVCERCMPHTHHLQSRMDILKQALLGADRVISPSASHGALHRMNGVDPDRLVVNRNGVRRPSRPRPQRRPGPVRFGYVGGNDPMKGVAVIRGAFAILKRSDWVLILVDNTLNLGFSSFQRFGRLKGEVQIVPAYKQDTMDAFFESIDVLLFPSQWKESFGLTVREALVRDVWVIATDSGGAAEEIVPGVNGTLVPMGLDHAPLARAIEALLDAPAQFGSHVNPYKDSIATLDDQATELHAILRAVSVGGRAVIEQQDEQDHDEQKHSETAAAPAPRHRAGGPVVAAVPAAPVACVAEAAESGDEQKDQQDVEQHDGRSGLAGA